LSISGDFLREVRPVFTDEESKPESTVVVDIFFSWICGMRIFGTIDKYAFMESAINISQEAVYLLVFPASSPARSHSRAARTNAKIEIGMLRGVPSP
jgi:hypothetical protein